MSPSLFYSTDATKDFDIVTMTWDLGPLIKENLVDGYFEGLLARPTISTDTMKLLRLEAWNHHIIRRT